MIAYPLKSMSLEEAQEMQFKLVDAVTQEFDGMEILNLGDLGVSPRSNRPETTIKVENVIARLFHAEGAAFVRGSGTAAIREALYSLSENGDEILVHDAPIYTTSITTLKQLGLKPIFCDFNNLDNIKITLDENPNIKIALVQYTRQKIDDSYEMKDVIEAIKSHSNIKVVTDDNYAVMKVHEIGSEMGADASCFSCFKLLGPEGIGCVVGTNEVVSAIKSNQYSGGSQTQGHEAMAVLRGLVYAPVSLAIQANQIEIITKKINEDKIPGIEKAVIANAQSKVILVKFDKPIAVDVLKESLLLGGAAYPVGAESKYEIAPMFYRVSGTMIKDNPEFKTHWIRINPMRAGSNTILRILEESIKKVTSCS